MDERKAKAVADALNGETWQSGGDIWVVLFQRPDGSLVVVSDEAVCEYATEGDFDDSEAAKTIFLRQAIPDLEEPERWVVKDVEGNTFYRDDKRELGWRSEYDAQREAMALQSRTGEHYLVERQT